jgi:hypothetical protein
MGSANRLTDGSARRGENIPAIEHLIDAIIRVTLVAMASPGPMARPQQQMMLVLQAVRRSAPDFGSSAENQLVPDSGRIPPPTERPL